MEAFLSSYTNTITFTSILITLLCTYIALIQPPR